MISSSDNPEIKVVAPWIVNRVAKLRAEIRRACKGDTLKRTIKNKLKRSNLILEKYLRIGYYCDKSTLQSKSK